MGMRSGNFFYVRTIERVEIALLDIFNNIKVNKYEKIDRKNIAKLPNGDDRPPVKVPLVTHFDKNFANWYQMQQEKKKLLPLPVMGLRFKSLVPNPRGRTQSTYLRNIFSKATEQWLQDIQPTPYFLNYTLNCLCDNRADLGQLIENILPYFNPQRCLRIKEFDKISDLERKVQVELISTNIEFQDELKNESKHRYIMFNIDFKCEIELYRVMEIAELIKYAELNIETDGIVDKSIAAIYPSDIVDKYKKAHETVSETGIRGHSILKTTCKTLVKKIDVSGNITFEDLSPPECDKPTNVPDIKQLDLWFDTDTDLELDQSPYDRNFTLLDIASRTHVPGFTPGSGQEVEDGGYEVDSSVSWNQILTWFGSNKGLNESPFTFRIKLQFTEPNTEDIVFQQLQNKETSEIPEGKVFFDWGIMQKKLYFSFATYGENALSYTFKTKDELEFNNTDKYTFVFALYDQGNSGIFGYSINDGSLIVLETERI